MPKFIGGREIVDFKVSKYKTPLGKDIYEVEFKDGGRKELIPVVMFEEIVSDNPLTPSEAQDRRVMPILKAIVDVIGEYDLKLSEWTQIHEAMKLTIENNYENAQIKLWGTDSKTFLDVRRVLEGVDK